MDWIDYFKCVIENKFTFAGYISLGSLIGLIEIDLPMNYKAMGVGILGISSFCNLALTVAGIETFEKYTRVREHIRKHGSVDPRFRRKIGSSYCYRKGLELAVKEAGIELTSFVDCNKTRKMEEWSTYIGSY